MNKLIEIGSTFLIPLSIPFMLKETNIHHKIAVFFLFISSFLYHYTNKKKKTHLNNNVYVHDKKFNIFKILDKICIGYIYLYNSRILEKYSFIIKLTVCFYMGINENRLLFFLLTCLISIIPYFTIIPLYQSFFFILSISIKMLLYLNVKRFTLLQKYIWHLASSFTMFTGCYINIAYSLPKTELYNTTNTIVKIVYFSLIINFIIYKNTLIEINKNDNNN